MSRKVFTAGEVLAAADVNSFLMDQTVMSFAGTAARGSAIPSPVEGMYTHLEDSDNLQFWNGSAWRSPAGETLLKTVSFSAAAGFNFGNNTLTSEFDNYKVVINLSGNTSPLLLQYRTGGVPNGTSNYAYAGSGLSTGNAAFSYVGASTAPWLFFTTTLIAGATIYVYGPNKSQNTVHTGEAFGVNDTAANLAHMNFGGNFLATTVFDDIGFFPGSGDITGTASIYGLRK
jgi:hypothetical protein